jgi:hypothetical protein
MISAPVSCNAMTRQEGISMRREKKKSQNTGGATFSSSALKTTGGTNDKTVKTVKNMRVPKEGVGLVSHHVAHAAHHRSAIIF